MSDKPIMPPGIPRDESTPPDIRSRTFPGGFLRADAPPSFLFPARDRPTQRMIRSFLAGSSAPEVDPDGEEIVSMELRMGRALIPRRVRLTLTADEAERAGWGAGGSVREDIEAAAERMRHQRGVVGGFAPFPGWTQDAEALARADGIDPTPFLNPELGEPWDAPMQASTPVRADVWTDPGSDPLTAIREAADRLRPAPDEPAAILVLAHETSLVAVVLADCTEEALQQLLFPEEVAEVRRVQQLHPRRALLLLGGRAWEEWKRSALTVSMEPGDRVGLDSGLPVYHVESDE
jgi:hypothetical protein